MEYLEACKTLGVKSDTPAAEVKIIYRRLVQEHHPDKGGDTERFKKITLAYRTFVSKRPFIRILRSKQDDAKKQSDAQTAKDPWEKEQDYANAVAAAWQREMDKAAEKESMQYSENRIALMITLVFFLLLILAWGNRTLVWLLIFAVLTCVSLAFIKDNVAYYVVITGGFLKSLFGRPVIYIIYASVFFSVFQIEAVRYMQYIFSQSRLGTLVKNLSDLSDLFFSAWRSLWSFLFG